MELARWPKRARTSTTTVMVIRPRGDGDVEKAVDDETASGTVGDNSFSGSSIVKKSVKKR